MKKKLNLALALSLSLFAVACGEKKAASGGESSVNSETSVSGENAESKSESASGAADAKEETAAEGEPTAARYLALKQGMSYEEVKKYSAPRARPVPQRAAIPGPTPTAGSLSRSLLTMTS